MSEKVARVRALAGPLDTLKNRYDPGKLFRLNHNIRPRG
jgi:hypothetical protein